MSTSGLAVADEDFNITTGSATVFALTSPADDEPTVEAFFEGAHPVYEGAQEQYSSQSIILREKQGSTAATQKGAFVASEWKIQNGTENAANSPANLKTNLELLGLQNLHRPMELTVDAGASFPPKTLTFTSGSNSLAITTDNLTGSNAGAHLENIRAKLAAASDLKAFHSRSLMPTIMSRQAPAAQTGETHLQRLVQRPPAPWQSLSCPGRQFRLTLAANGATSSMFR